MVAWKKGAIIGMVWGVSPFILDYILHASNISTDIIPRWLGLLLGLTFYIAKYHLGFVYMAIIIGSPLVGILIGAFIGLLFDLRKERKLKGKIEFNYWQKGAILGLFWSFIGFIVIFYYEKTFDITRGLPDVILVPIAVLFLIISFPAFFSGFFGPMKYFWGFVLGYLFGALFGHVYVGGRLMLSPLIKLLS
ncbi:MAG: hypothetical protein ACXADW_22540 [Candidatus Hodarchaeales archaeon]|jgi:hypothetical protein